jgi:6-pyruvoyltetrahydropterin/6-carboxytetrahydropterin synthase
MTTQLTIKHNFETAHRLPFLGGKCSNLHGHSWWVTFTIFNLEYGDKGVDENGLSVEFGDVKKMIRYWIDEHLDHGTMLGAKDPLFEEGTWLMFGKAFFFGDTQEEEGASVPPSYRYAAQPWPTVEAVAEMLCYKIQELLDEQKGMASLYVDRVELQETHVNGVVYIQG